MKQLIGLFAVAGLALAGGAAQAATVSDPAGDFLPTYTGPLLDDLDVTSFSVGFNAATNRFLLSSSFAAAINPATAGSYIIGVRTGPGGNAPFGSLGQPNVIFDQAITIRKDGTGNVGATALPNANIIISGNSFIVSVPLTLLPSTGFSSLNYAFNIWPRAGAGNANITDFAPNNANLVAGAVPEPASWAMMIAGLGAAGGMMRSRRRAGHSFA